MVINYLIYSEPIQKPYSFKSTVAMVMFSNENVLMSQSNSTYVINTEIKYNFLTAFANKAQ